MKLTIVRGMPGAGKTTFSKKHFSCCVLENDQMQTIDGEYRWTPGGVKAAARLVYSLADQILANGSDVAVCNTFTRKKSIERYRRLAEKHGATFEVIRCNGRFQNVHNVPEATMKSMKEGFEDWPGETVASFP